MVDDELARVSFWFC